MWQRFAAVGVIGAGAFGWWSLSPEVEVEAVSTEVPAPAGEGAPQAAAPEPSGPRIEVARFNPGGAGIIAGSVSVPGVVRVMLGEIELARAEPDSAGQFAVFVTVPVSDAPQRLTLAQDGRATPGSVIVAPAAEPETVASGQDAAADSAPVPESGSALASEVEEEVVAAGEDAGLTVEEGKVSDASTSAPSASEDASADAEGTSQDIASVVEPTVPPQAAQASDLANAPPAAETREQVALGSATQNNDPSPLAQSPTEPPAAEVVQSVAAPDPQPGSAPVGNTPPGPEAPVAQAAALATRAPATVEAAQSAPAPVSVVAPVAVPAPAPSPAQAPTGSRRADAPVLVSDAAGVRVLDQSRAKPDVALDAISYDPLGNVGLAGRANATRVQIYLDNRPLTAAPVRRDGDWRIDLPQVSRGVYTLRVDAMDDSGAVVSRLETPFKREAPEDIARVMAEDTAAPGFDVAVRTVQPGNTLWAIARETYGEGVLYVHVFQANADLIRDPDLIYPGQIFRLPELSE